MFVLVSDVDFDWVMSGYYVGYFYDLKGEDMGMFVIVEDVGIFLRVLNDGFVFDGEEQEIYLLIYVYEYIGLIFGYQSIVRYYRDIDVVVVQFMGLIDFEGYNWGLVDIVYGWVLKILCRNK